MADDVKDSTRSRAKIARNPPLCNVIISYLAVYCIHCTVFYLYVTVKLLLKYLIHIECSEVNTMKYYNISIYFTDAHVFVMATVGSVCDTRRQLTKLLRRYHIFTELKLLH